MISRWKMLKRSRSSMDVTSISFGFIISIVAISVLVIISSEGRENVTIIYNFIGVGIICIVVGCCRCIGDIILKRVSRFRGTIVSKKENSKEKSTVTSIKLYFNQGEYIDEEGRTIIINEQKRLICNHKDSFIYLDEGETFEVTYLSKSGVIIDLKTTEGESLFKKQVTTYQKMNEVKTFTRAVVTLAIIINMSIIFIALELNPNYRNSMIAIGSIMLILFSVMGYMIKAKKEKDKEILSMIIIIGTIYGSVFSLIIGGMLWGNTTLKDFLITQCLLGENIEEEIGSIKYAYNLLALCTIAFIGAGIRLRRISQNFNICYAYQALKKQENIIERELIDYIAKLNLIKEAEKEIYVEMGIEEDAGSYILIICFFETDGKGLSQDSIANVVYHIMEFLYHKGCPTSSTDIIAGDKELIGLKPEDIEAFALKKDLKRITEALVSAGYEE